MQKQDGILKDTPRMPHGDKNSRQIFETTALATKGTQAGTYYGSVRWGWRTDAAGAYTKLPLEKVADGIPSSTFLKSAEIWNTGKAAGGAANVKLPVPEVKKTSGPVTAPAAGPDGAAHASGRHARAGRDDDGDARDDRAGQGHRRPEQRDERRGRLVRVGEPCRRTDLTSRWPTGSS